MVNFLFERRSGAGLTVLLAPMKLEYRKLPHFESSRVLPTSVLLVNPGNANFYRDNLEEVAQLIDSSWRNAGAGDLYFAGSSMGAYGALLFGTMFRATKGILAFAPCLRLDRLGSLSQRNMAPEVLAQGDGSVIEVLNRTQVETHIALPCIDNQDGAHMEDARQLRNPHVHVHNLYCRHDIHTSLNLITTLHKLVRGDLTRSDFEPLYASQLEIDAAVQVYHFLRSELAGDRSDLGLPDMPLEGSRNWMYFYWKARYLSRRGKAWESLNNFTQALALGGAQVPEVYVCMANVAKDLGMKHVAIGGYREAGRVGLSQTEVQRMVGALGVA